MSDNWRLEVKFQGKTIPLVGRLPSEKRHLLHDFPHKLSVHTRAKHAAIPSKGVFCKFVMLTKDKNSGSGSTISSSNYCEDMKLYMQRHSCALCVNFAANMYNCTLFLIVPSCLKPLKCLHRLKKNGASDQSIDSLCKDREGVVIGFIVSEVNQELQAKIQRRQQTIQELANTAKLLSNDFKDPLLELDLLLDQFDTKPGSGGNTTAIQYCAKFIVKHQLLCGPICERITRVIRKESTTSKTKMNLIFLVHEVIKSVRATVPPEKRLEADFSMKNSSKLVGEMEPNLKGWLDCLPQEARQSQSIRAVLEYWKKWQLDFTKANGTCALGGSLERNGVGAAVSNGNGEHDLNSNSGDTQGGGIGNSSRVHSPTQDTVSTTSSGPFDMDISPLDDDFATSPTTAASTSSPVKAQQLAQQSQQNQSSSSLVSEQAVAFMKQFSIPPGPWEVFLSRATREELDELEAVMQVNAKYHAYNKWEATDKGGRRSGENFLHQYVKTHMAFLLQSASTANTQKIRNSLKRKHPDGKRPVDLLRLAFLCTFDVDESAERAVMSIDEGILDDIWKKMEKIKCQNNSAFVFGKIRRIKTKQYATNPHMDKLLERAKKIKKEDNDADENEPAVRRTKDELVNQVISVFKMDSLASAALRAVGKLKVVAKIVIQLCERCRDRMVANPSIHVIQLCKQAEAKHDPKKAYSVGMRSMMNRQMKLSSVFSQAAAAAAASAIKKQKTSATSSSSPATESDSASTPAVELSDAELAALKRRIPKPPKLLFKKVDLKTITYTETNDNGTVGVAKSGIPDAGRGLFNLSSHPWPAFSVVCIFGVRRITQEMHHDGLTKVARCGELGETFVVVNGTVRDVEMFQTQYGHRLVPFDGLVDAEGSVGGFPNDRVYEYPADVYWDASGFYNNCILVPGCIVDPQDSTSPIMLNQLYIVTWKEVAVREEFFLAYGTSYYEDEYNKSSDKNSEPDSERGPATANGVAIANANRNSKSKKRVH